MRRIMARGLGTIAFGGLLLMLIWPASAFGRVRLHFGFGTGVHPHRFQHPRAFVVPHAPFHRPHVFIPPRHFRHPAFVPPREPFRHAPGLSLHFRVGPQFRHHNWHTRHHPRAFGSPFTPRHRWR